MNIPVLWAPIALLLFLSIAGAQRAGWYVGRRRIKTEGGNANEGLGAVDGAIFGMMGLLLAFSFTGAASRFDNRRDLIVEETNAIGTAWLRLDLLQEAPRQQAQDLFRQYLDARLAVHRNVADETATENAIRAVAGLQEQIWQLLLTQVREDRTQPLAQALLPSVNDMFDIGTLRVLALSQHPPSAIYVMLGVLIVVSAFVAGFSQAKTLHQSVLHVFGFAAITTLAFYITIDLEYPRLGLIRVDAFDRALTELRESMQ